MPPGFPEWVARHWDKAREVHQATKRGASGPNPHEPPLDSWLESKLIPAIRAALPDWESVGDPGVAILALLVHLSHPKMGPPPKSVCSNLWQLLPAADAAATAGDERKKKRNQSAGDDPDHSADNGGPPMLAWLAWLFVAMGSGAWRHPKCPTLEEKWGAFPWPNAITELEIMAANALLRILTLQFPVVPGFNDWLKTEVAAAGPSATENSVLRQIARECAFNIVLGFTQRIGGAGAPAPKDALETPSRKENFRYLRYWNPKLGTLPLWVVCLVRGYAGEMPSGAGPGQPGFIPLGLPNIFSGGWAFAEVAKRIPIFHGRAALQPCDHPGKKKSGDASGHPTAGSTRRTHIFWQERCDCGLPLERVIEDARFVMRPACWNGFFFLCKKCEHYTFHSENTPDQPVASDPQGLFRSSAVLDALAAQIESDDALEADLLDLGMAAGEFIVTSEAPLLLADLAEWLIGRAPNPKIANARELLQRCLESLRKAKTDSMETDELGMLLLQELVALLIGDEAPGERPMKPPHPKVKPPEGFVCSLCKSSANVSRSSTYLWMRRPPNPVLISRAPSPSTGGLPEDHHHA